MTPLRRRLLFQLITLYECRIEGTCADCCTGRQYDVVQGFCGGLSLCVRGHYFRRYDVRFNVFCFVEKDHAKMFCVKFGGQMVDEKSHGKGR
jgi:hypothetical protein